MTMFPQNCNAGSFPYMIRKGDTLYSISRRFNTNVKRLLEINKGIVPENLQIGSYICVPLPKQDYPFCRTTNYYVVDEQDTIYSIAKYFGITEKQLLYYNIGIDPENIYKGMVLCIPFAPSPVVIEVTSGRLTLKYKNGETESFNCITPRIRENSVVIQKQLDSSIGGSKRLNLLVPGRSICSAGSLCSNNSVIVSDEDMDIIFNRTPIGTEVKFV